ncbi:MAG: hypothetical protein JSV62_10035 [Promethearchaeota archaeon]|nr:MAG: hypothetical protein JSV62_10035 [Candidatus Lokiarchaeota archaeon]
MKKTNLMRFLLTLFASLIFLSFSLPIGYSNEVGIFDGLYIEHIYTLSPMPGEEIPMTMTFSKTSEDMFNIENELKNPINDIGSWDVNTTTRIISNVVKFGPFEGNHSVFWIYTDVSINDQIRMCNIWRCVHGYDGDVLFNVTGEAMHGSMEVWQLEDDYGSLLWYEKTIGFLVNGTINHLTDWNSYEFSSTNAFDTTVASAIPSYMLIIIVPVIGIVSIGFAIFINRKKKS